MRCAACDVELEAFTGDVCPHCQHFAHPTRLGIYDGLELIRRGGMGSVYRARHPELGTLVAIKTVHTHAGPDSLAERFRREARLAARIPHPGVVRVFDHDCREGRLYLVMEYIAGTTLRQPIEDGDRGLEWKLDKVAQLAEVLQTAHERGIVHRDIKPENVMVDATGRVRVLDFGISQVLEEGERLTQTGEILGTPEYIAPEQILDVPEAVDARTDVYATGVVLYELLTGTSPFAGGNLFQVLKNVESREPPPPSHLRADIPAALDALVLACLAKDRGRRPADGGELARRLRALPRDGGRAPAPRRLGLAGVTVGLAAGVSIALAWPRDPERRSAGNPLERATTDTTDTIRTLLAASGTPARAALEAACREIGATGSPEELYWRGRARLRTGALLLARRDLQAARLAGHAAAGIHAAIAELYATRLLAALLPGGSTLAEWDGVPVDGDGPVAAGLRALAANDFARACSELAAVADPQPDIAILLLFARVRDAGSNLPPVTAQDAGAIAPRNYLPRVLLAALLAEPAAGTALLEAAVQRSDRLAPMRYVLEIVIAARVGDDARLRAALELTQVTGAPEFALATFAAIRIERYERLAPADRAELQAITAELREPHGPALRRALLDQENRHGK